MIRSFTAENFCQHRKLHVDFHHRMTAIIGPNGSGKSNIFAGIIGALCNEWINSGNKDSNVTYGTELNSSVAVEFHHNSIKGKVRRHLRAGRSSLRLSSEDAVIEGEDRITQAVLDVLGINKKMLQDYVLVRQGSISGILSMTPAERSKSFQRLFGTERCEQIYDACLGTISRYSPDQDFSEADVIMANLETTKKSIDEANMKLHAINDEIPPKSSIEDMKRCVSDHDKWIDLSNRIDKLNSLITACRGRVTQEDEALKKWSGVLSEAEKTAEQVAPKASMVSSNLQMFDLWKERVAERKKIQGRLEEIADRQLAIDARKPDQPIVAEPRPHIEVEMQSEVKTIETLLRSVDPETGEGECPICRTPGTRLLEYARNAEARAHTLKEDIATIQQARRDWDKFAIQTEEWKAESQRLVNTKDSLLLSLEQVKPPKKPDGTEEEWRKTEVKYAELLKQIKSAREVVADQQALLNTSIGTLNAYRQELAVAEKEVTGLKFDADSVAAAVEQLEEIEVLSLKRSEVTGTLQALETSAKQLGAHLKKIQEAKKAYAKKLKTVEAITRVRSAFHRDGIPARVSRAYLQALTEGSEGFLSVNDLLEVFDAPFRVEMREEDLSFMAHFDAGHIQPAERLSGGEKVILALALRTSINALFASDLSMMFLDEVTEYLDENNLSCLHMALERLGQLAEDRGMQVVVITHERELAPLFDQVIELES